MHKERFHFTEEPREDGVRVFHAHGRLCDASPCFEFQERACSAIKEEIRGVLIDLAEVDHLDSCGIGILAAIVASSRNAGHPVVLAAAPVPVERVLDSIWFLNLVEHTRTVEEGIERIREHLTKS